MTNARNSAIAQSALVVLAYALIGCYPAETFAERCVSQYPRPTDSQIAGDAMSIPVSTALAGYRPGDSLPEIYNADSSIGWFRNLFYARFDAFRSEQEVRSFILRFQARIVDRADTNGWYTVMIPDPGPDTSNFNLLLHCIGANYGVYVRSAYSRHPLSFLGDTTSPMLRN